MSYNVERNAIKGLKHVKFENGEKKWDSQFVGSRRVLELKPFQDET